MGYYRRCIQFVKPHCKHNIVWIKTSEALSVQILLQVVCDGYRYLKHHIVQRGSVLL